MGKINYQGRETEWSFDINHRLYMVYVGPCRYLEKDIKIYHDKLHKQWKFSDKGIVDSYTDEWIDVEYEIKSSRV